MNIDRRMMMRMGDLLWNRTVTVAFVGPQLEFGSPLSPGLKVMCFIITDSRGQVGLKPPLTPLTGPSEWRL